MIWYDSVLSCYVQVQIIHRNSKYTEDEMYYKQDGLLIVAFWVEVSLIFSGRRLYIGVFRTLSNI